jgi:predicted nucleic acid-binding protein
VNIIVDSSTALSWYFEDEANPYGEEILSSVTDHGALVPFHWKAEVANGLMMGVRRQRISLEYRDRVFAELDSLGITHDFVGHEHVWPSASAIAVEHGLTIYDAIYIELARRRGYLLATLDKKLGRAAKAVGVYLEGSA